jgi:sec-independent protein translocase protein TatA
MFGSLGITELLVILAVVVLLFGAKRIPEIGRALGQTIGAFRNGFRGVPPSADRFQPPGNATRDVGPTTSQWNDDTSRVTRRRSEDN